MQIKYKGMDKNYEYRIAELFARENEIDKLESMLNNLYKLGWKNQDNFEDYAIIEVEDERDYRQLVKDYKNIKKEL